MQSRRKVVTNTAVVKCGSMAEAQARYNYGQATIRQIADEAGATIRFGRTVRYNFTKIDKYLDELSK